MHTLLYHCLYADYISLFAISCISCLIPPSCKLPEIILEPVTTAGDQVTKGEGEIVAIRRTGQFLVLHRELHDQVNRELIEESSERRI